MVQLTKVLKADIIYPNKKKFTGKCNFSRYIYQLGANQFYEGDLGWETLLLQTLMGDETKADL